MITDQSTVLVDRQLSNSMQMYFFTSFNSNIIAKFINNKGYRNDPVLYAQSSLVSQTPLHDPWLFWTSHSIAHINDIPTWTPPA